MELTVSFCVCKIILLVRCNLLLLDKRERDGLLLLAKVLQVQRLERNDLGVLYALDFPLYPLSPPCSVCNKLELFFFFFGLFQVDKVPDLDKVVAGGGRGLR